MVEGEASISRTLSWGGVDGDRGVYSSNLHRVKDRSDSWAINQVAASGGKRAAGSPFPASAGKIVAT
jgi:hypothetical protein